MCVCAWVCASWSITNPDPLFNHLPRRDKAEANTKEHFIKGAERENREGKQEAEWESNDDMTEPHRSHLPLLRSQEYVVTVSPLCRICVFYNSAAVINEWWTRFGKYSASDSVGKSWRWRQGQQVVLVYIFRMNINKRYRGIRQSGRNNEREKQS